MSHPKTLVKVKTLENFKGDLPIYQSHLSSGFDIVSQNTKDIVIQPMERVLIPTGLCFEIPSGYELQVRSRSGWSLKEGVVVINSPGTIDADYRGELKIILANFSDKSVLIKPQARVAQAVLSPVFHVTWAHEQELSKTQRGSEGFGSTGFVDST